MAEDIFARPDESFEPFLAVEHGGETKVEFDSLETVLVSRGRGR